MDTDQRFLQGVFSFRGRGRADPVPLDTDLRYVVPAGRSAQPGYFRGRNDSGALIYIVLVRDGAAMRHFPIAAGGEVRVPLRVVEDLPGGTTVELHIAAPAGLTGSVMIDLALAEIPAGDGGAEAEVCTGRTAT